MRPIGHPANSGDTMPVVHFRIDDICLIISLKPSSSHRLIQATTRRYGEVRTNNVYTNLNLTAALRMLPRCLSHDTDCAVCAKGFAPGASHRCHACSGDVRGLVTGLTTAGLVLVLLLVIIAVHSLLKPVSEGVQEGQDGEYCWWPRMISSLHKAVIRAIPFTAVRIVVVILQIVIQVRTLKNDNTIQSHTPLKPCKQSTVGFKCGQQSCRTCYIPMRFEHNRVP